MVKSPVYNVEIKFDELCKSEEVFDDGEIVEKLYQYCNKEVDNWIEGNNHSTMMRATAKGTSQAEEKSRLKQFEDSLCVNLKIAMSVYRKENGASEDCKDSSKDSINNLKRSAKEMEGHIKSVPGKSAVAIPK